MIGVPCQHAIAWKNERAEDYMHQWLTMDAFNATYAHCIQPANSEEHWAKSEYNQLIPPIIKRPISHPKKQRKKNQDKDVSGHRVRRTVEVICLKCGQYGHYAKTCKGIGAKKPKRK